MTVNINRSPAATAGPDQVKCQEKDGTVTFSLNGTASSGTPAWSVVGSTDSANASILTPGSAATNVNVTGTGSVTLKLTVKSNATPSCGEATDEVVLTVNPCAVAPAPVMGNTALLLVALALCGITAARLNRRRKRAD
jgi:hypothetical protein